IPILLLGLRQGTLRLLSSTRRRPRPVQASPLIQIRGLNSQCFCNLLDRALSPQRQIHRVPFERLVKRTRFAAAFTFIIFFLHGAFPLPTRCTPCAPLFGRVLRQALCSCPRTRPNSYT